MWKFYTITIEGVDYKQIIQVYGTSPRDALVEALKEVAADV